MSWDPTIYLTYDDERTRPAGDLLARVPLQSISLGIDLGCGPGNSTAKLRTRFPNAQLIGVDNSAAMLEKARGTDMEAEWVEADIAAYEPPGGADLIYSNAALHWLDDHAALFPKLLNAVNPGGVLAVQMPNNFAAPSHTVLQTLTREAPWRDRLNSEGLHRSIGTPDFYYGLLAPHAAQVDIWQTEYLHVLTGPDPVLTWIGGSALRPILDALPEEDRAEFRTTCASRLKAAYPERPDGTTLFAFKRLFLIAIRK